MCQFILMKLSYILLFIIKLYVNCDYVGNYNKTFLFSLTLNNINK